MVVHRVFLDANVLFSAAWAATSVLRRLWTFDPSVVTLLSSDWAIAEVRRNLPERKHEELNRLLRSVEEVVTPPSSIWRPLDDVSLPEKDERILWAAIGAGATHLLSGDRQHFGPLYGREVEGVLILLPAAYHRDE
jgi:predicted nucleic acid-binding protein